MKWNKAAFEHFPYTITENNHFWTQHPEFDKKSGAEFSKVYRKGIEDGKPVERDIRQCIAKWPTVPGFQWMLAECLSYHDEDEMDLVLDALLENHPESIFTLVTQLTRVVTHDDEPPTFFGMEDSLELHELFPARTQFHAFEVFLYECALFFVAYDLSGGECEVERHQRYRAMIDGLVHANQLAALSEIVYEKHPGQGLSALLDEDLDDEDDEDDDDDEDEDDDYDEEEYEFSPEAFARQQRLRLRLASIQTTLPPQFQLSVTTTLYSAPVMLPTDLMQDLLAQDRAQLIADLELILQDAAARYEYFQQQGEAHYAVLHAFILLCHFQSVNSLPSMLSFLARTENVLDFWLDDALNRNVPQWMAPLLQHDITAFDTLILDGDAFEFARIAAIAALEQFVYHWPERKTEVEEHLLLMLAAINAHDASLLDQGTLNSYLTTVAAALKMKRLHQAMKPLFDQDKVDALFIGTWKEAVHEFKQRNDDTQKWPLYLDDLHSKYTEGLNWLNHVFPFSFPS